MRNVIRTCATSLQTVLQTGGGRAACADALRICYNLSMHHHICILFTVQCCTQQRTHAHSHTKHTRAHKHTHTHTHAYSRTLPNTEANVDCRCWHPTQESESCAVTPELRRVSSHRTPSEWISGFRASRFDAGTASVFRPQMCVVF
jgi:hypothetical protein